MNLEFIFKIIDKQEWQKAKQAGTYNGSDNLIKKNYRVENLIDFPGH